MALSASVLSFSATSLASTEPHQADAHQTDADSTHSKQTSPRPSSLGKVPAVDILPEERGPRQPNLSVGVLPAVCGFGTERIWQGTRFCLGGVLDLLWGRKHESESGWGLAFEAGSSGFVDFRAGLSGAGFVPLSHWFGLGVRAGPLLRIEGVPTVGGRVVLEVGHRNFYTETHYSLMHALFVAVDVTAAPNREPAAQAIWLGVRLDGFWLTAPAWWLQ